MVTGYCTVEMDFIPPFDSGIMYFYSNKQQPIDTKRLLEKFGCEKMLIIRVEIEKGCKLFDIRNIKHRNKLYNYLPNTVKNDKGLYVRKDVIIAELMGVGLDSREVSIINTYEDTIDSFDTDYMISVLKELGFEGFISKEEGFESYMVFNAKESVKVLDMKY